MARIRGRDTSPEVALRSALWHLGLRYRVNLRIGSTRPDIAFLGPKLAVFVDGCFWHSCPIHAVIPKTNREFWLSKLTRNKVRDSENNEFLIKEGWQVLRFWEHEIKDHAALCAKQVQDMIRGGA